MKLILKNKKLPDINLQDLKDGETFRFFKNKTLESSVIDDEIYMKLVGPKDALSYVQLSGDCAVVKRYGPQVGYKVKTRIKSYNVNKKDLLPLGAIEIGEIVSLYEGNKVFNDGIFMIGNNPLEKKLITLIDLSTGKSHQTSDSVLCAKHITSLIIKGN